MKAFKHFPNSEEVGTFIVDCICSVLIFSMIFFISTFILDYISLIQKNNGVFQLNRENTLKLIGGFGVFFMLAGIYLGRAFRTHSIYHDIKDVNDETAYAELAAAVKEYGRKKGWVKK